MTCSRRSHLPPAWRGPGGFCRLDREVTTKDADFVDSHLLYARPEKLLLISTGNISNRELEALVVPLIPIIDHEFHTHSFLELGRMGILIRE
jgi:predicted nuclease of predicted toxin-antitoxin system